MRLLPVFLALFLGCTLRSAAAPRDPSPQSRIENTATHISIDYPDTEVRRVLRDVADYFELNLVLPEEFANHRTSITVRNATWPQIFDAVLLPLGYTYYDDENILRVVRRADDSSVQVKTYPLQPTTDAASDEPRLFWLIVALNSLPLALNIPVGIAHTILFIAVLRDHPSTAPRFAPKWVWAMATLLSGFVALCAYWLLHHARPTRTGAQRPEQS